MMLVQAQSYREQYGFNTIYLLPVNLYGPRDNFDLQTSHVIPALIRKFVEANESGAQDVVLWGDGSPTREFLYVEDAAEGVLLATERYDGPFPANLGTGEETTIKQLAEMIAAEVNYSGRFIWDTSKPNGQPRRCLDVTRAKELFGFEAVHRLRDGIPKTVAWFMANRASLRQVVYS
jgi:GDP-L-fucose synthase